MANAVSRLKDSNAKSKVVILLTDGVNNRGSVGSINMLLNWHRLLESGFILLELEVWELLPIRLIQFMEFRFRISLLRLMKRY
ncbi:MAG: hypothetical protein MZV63_44855 [Marinilabiliales bacterium]|nr:hypothetical protein [Marinilabiliales bacterium]